MTSVFVTDLLTMTVFVLVTEVEFYYRRVVTCRRIVYVQTEHYIEEKAVGCLH